MSRVLLVEDDLEQLSLFSTVLTRAGCLVTAVPTGESALATLSDAQFDLLLTDLYLPGLPGDRLVRLVQRRHPGVRTILMSGRTDLARVATGCGADGHFAKGDIRRLIGLLMCLFPAEDHVIH